MNTILFSVPPGPPLDLRTTRIGRNFVYLEWRPPRDNGGSKITKYIIQKKKEIKDNWSSVMKVDASETSWQVTELKEGAPVYLSVAAENKAGPGKPCELANAVIPTREMSKYKKSEFIFFMSVHIHKIICKFDIYKFLIVRLIDLVSQLKNCYMIEKYIFAHNYNDRNIQLAHKRNSCFYDFYKKKRSLI